jgi:uncharacterized protein
VIDIGGPCFIFQVNTAKTTKQGEVRMLRPVHFEFQAEDPERAAQFYRTLFGWNVQKWDGPVEYWLIMTGNQSEPGINGGLMKRRPGAEDFTATYNTIDVPNLDEYMAKATASGGTIVVPKMPVPGVGWLAYCKDTEGTIFGMMQPDQSAK